MILNLRPLVIAAMLLAGGNLFAYTFTWNGNSSTSWTSSSNWTRTGSGSGNSTPGTNDSVVINTLGGSNPRYPSLTASATIAKLTMNGGSITTNSNFVANVAFLLKGGSFNNTSGNITAGLMTVTGGTLTINNDINVTNAITVTGGNLNADGEVTAGTVLVNGGTFTLSGSGHTLTAATSITITSGTLDGGTTDIKTNSGGDLSITGGTLKMQGSNILISDDFTIDGGTVDILSSTGAFPQDLFLKSGTLDLSNHTMTIGGTFTYTGGTITNASDLSINDLSININSPMILTGDLNITGTLTFVKGMIKSTSTNLVIFGATATTSGASNTSHVNGPVRRLLSSSNDNTNTTRNSGFNYPVGDGTHYAPVTFTEIDDSRSQDHFTVQYFNTAYSNVSTLASGLNHVSHEEYWTIDRGASFGTPTTDVKIKLSFNENERSGQVDNASLLRIAHWNGTQWEAIGSSVTTSGNNSAGTITSPIFNTNFSPFTIGASTALNPLPVSLIDFSAKAGEKVVNLHWTTSSEINNDHYTVEKSVDGHNWFAVATVKGAVNSDKVMSYQAIDANPVAGVQYYRLAMVDLNGLSAYSQLVAVNYATNKVTGVSLFPNPVYGNLNVSIQGDASSVATVSVYNVFGQKVMETTGQGGSVLNVDMSALQNGVYVIEVSMDGVVSKTNIVKN